MLVRQLSHPTDSELEQAAAVLTAAFARSPDTFGHSMMGGDMSLDPLFQMAGLRAGAIGGEIWVAGFSPSEICAVALWFGPGSDYLATEEQRAAGWDDLVANFPPELKQWWLEYFIPRASTWSESCLGKGTKTKGWHLHLLGTSPDHQHKGLAAALIQAVESKANGLPMVLETTNDGNVTFYKRRGFVVRGETSIVGSGGEITMTCMSKP
ncbi:hypothetical protein FB45DRAFT_1031574 [Roridomyces roridus]|uniref:N-acetyltransferase domain-containing protein n=1 Tax=Roridomyces roridus TaxID=1738132 RepID=A0AAD7BKQ7_9AGAR|nr:hypothetical protein FB45DRAFT_1031574 [Roridomyces roridus]